MNHRTVKAERAVIHLGEIPLEVFRLPDGTYRLSQTQSAEAVDKPDNSFRRFLSNGKFENHTIDRIAVEGNNVKIKALPIALAIEYWKDEAIRGNKRAINLLEEIKVTSDTQFALFQGNYIVVTKAKERASAILKTRVAKYSEAWYVLKLKRQLGGEREVPTEAGNIDLLTSTELIEVKEVKGWKCAIGQVEVYGDYYPLHTKRIHLFGRCTSGYLEMIHRHCNKKQITLTHED